MTNEPAGPAAPPQASGHGTGAPDESVREVVARLIEDGRAYAAAEAEKQKLRAGIVMVGVRNAAILGAVAVMLLFAGIVALLVGLVLALAPILAPLWASLIVFGGALCVVILLLLLARSCIGRMKKALAP